MPDFTSPSFQKPQYAVLVNILWFLSLVVALITASLGILVKQWFHELMSYETHDPKERLYLRFFREAGLEKWKVFAVASALPLLLQLALLLFFIGLGLFLHQQDPVVAWVTTGVMVLWLAAFVFTVSMPMFSSQCPYKIPLLKVVYHWARQTSRENLSKLQLFCLWILGHIGGSSLTKTVSGWFQGVVDILTAFEEDEVSKDGTLALPIVLHVKNVLRGERLNDSIGECLGDVSDNDMKRTLEEISKEKAAIKGGMLPSLLEPQQALDKLALDTFQDQHLRLNLLCQKANPYLVGRLYSRLRYLKYADYSPVPSLSDNTYILPPQSIVAFIHLFQENSTSAAFSFLTMYSIRHRTLTDHPDSFNSLFYPLSHSEKHSHGIGKLRIPSPSPPVSLSEITGDQFLLNLVAATGSLIRCLWDRPQGESDDSKIRECFQVIRDNAYASHPVCSPDPIAFICVLAEVLAGLAPEDVVGRCEEKIYELMCELAGVVNGVDEQLTSKSRRKCVEQINPDFWSLYLRRGFESPCSVPLYLFFAPLQYKAYKPLKNYPISYQSLLAFIRLIQANPASAGFSFLTMYSIRHRALTDHPNSFDHLFHHLPNSEKFSHGIGMLTIPLPSPFHLTETRRR